mmetsp:Transcript_108343/g.170885  ORF Transcript_108343/g.170885 Transcript_108343/m.170885 type:complete len:574 (-) Transcript_108343:169-1890(-)|eukprot:CAMPEP_0169071296 /NCGR_PEP_ID=MMETSP1015-20121227/5583_1 /TAXON_ID=342587 /ORGANISM="Karlodinium micrum, Strain CCMP2283" /LENGTH=573 /DNA_ID=CAMNT_0009130371 /DNA_START=102 /DNA_END=1823 /DNA_ORIENTATION=+
MADRHEGVIKSFSDKSQYGFIQCEEASRTYGCDVFLSARELGNCKVKDEVTFRLEINKTGKPQAYDVRRIAEESFGEDEQAAEAENMRLPGVVRSIDKVSGFGFITCAEVTETYGQDVFVAAQDIGSFRPGTDVSFVFFENQQGKPQGRDLMPLEAGSSARAGSAHEEGVSESAWQGTIKSFATKTGYGFIECEEAKSQYGCDVFLTARDAGGFSVGDLVSFDCSLNNSKKPQASNLRKLEDRGGPAIIIDKDKGGKGKGASSDQRGGTRSTGVIKSYAEKSGYGFISCPECTSQYGCDAFLMAADLGSFGVGDHVTFDLVINNKGKPQARNLSSADGSGGHGGAGGSFTGFKGNWGQKDGGGKGGKDGGKDAGCFRGWGGMDGCWGGMVPMAPMGWWGGKDAGCWGGKGGMDGFGWCGKGPPMMCWGGWGGMDGACKGKDAMCWGGKDAGAWCGMKGESAGMCGKGAGAYGHSDRGVASGKASGRGDGPPAKKPKIDYKRESDGERYTGVVRSYTPSTGYGFIDCAEVKEKYGFDTYYKGVQLGGAGVGDKVTFAIKLTPDGKPQADAVKPA